MRFGLFFANVGPYARPDNAVTLARAAEAAGFESLWTVEHTVVPAGYESDYPYDRSGRMPGPEDSPIPDPLIWLAYVAAATTTIKLATGILIAPQRHPVLLAKETGTLASLSGDRLVLGVGAGWLAEEFDALDVPFAERGRRLDDHIGALRALWAGSPASYDGAFTSFKDIFCEPRPPAGSIPIVIGGHSPVAARRAGRLGDGFFPGRAGLAQLSELFETAHRSAVDAGRDPAGIELTAPADRSFFTDPLGTVEAYRQAGVSRLVVPPLSYDPATVADALGRFGQDVIARVS
jgi:probable F420-dependent oxidoreductase